VDCFVERCIRSVRELRPRPFEKERGELRILRDTNALGRIRTNQRAIGSPSHESAAFEQ
jgi:hypothetical protein